MTTLTAPARLFHRQVVRTEGAPATVSRGRRNLAATIDLTLDPRLAVRRGLRTWPRIPQANREVVEEPLSEVAALLRDPDFEVSDESSRRVLKLATHPTSAVYGAHPNRASFAAWSLLAELRAHAVRIAA